MADLDFQPTVNLAEYRRPLRSRPGHWAEQDNARRYGETTAQHAERVANRIDPITPPLRLQRVRAVFVWLFSPAVLLAALLVHLLN